jgi:hypothetical protein
VAVLIGLGSFKFVKKLILKGIIWLVLGSAIEIPPLVSPGGLSFVPFCLYPICVAGVVFVASEW